MIRYRRYTLREMAWMLLSAALSFPFVGCGPGVGEGPLPEDTDTLTLNTDRDTETSIPVPPVTCPSQIDDDCPQIDSEPIVAVLSATDAAFSNPTRFVTMAPNIILATETVGEELRPFTISFSFEYNDSGSGAINHASLARLPEIDDPVPPIPVTVVYWSTAMVGSQFNKIAILRHESVYRLWGIPESGTGSTLISLTQLDLPSTAEFHGGVYLNARTTLSQNDHPGLDTLCLFGEGLACLHNGIWTSYLSPEGPRIMAVSVENRDETILVIASREDGSVAHVDPTATQALQTEQLVDGRLTAIAAMPNNTQHTLAGDNGILIRTATDADPIVCDTPLGAILSINHQLNRSYFSLLTAQGEVYDGEINSAVDGYLCRRNFQTAQPPIIGFPMAASYFVLTSTTLYGKYWNPIVIM